MEIFFYTLFCIANKTKKVTFECRMTYYAFTDDLWVIGCLFDR